MKQRSTHAQNRISYIVYSDPEAIRELMDQYGYDPPKNVHDLVEATKDMVREQGVQFVTDLLEQHPDRDAILRSQAAQLPASAHANYCGACGTSNYDGTQPPLPLHEMTTEQIQRYYEELKAEAREFPEDSTLSAQIELVWTILNQRKDAKATEEETDGPTAADNDHKFSVSQKQLVTGVLAFVFGAIAFRAFFYNS